MAIDYQSKVDLQNLVDERFSQEAKTNGITNQNFDFSGAKSVEVYDISTATMNDYSRTGTDRYGTVEDLNATVQEMLMSQDRSFTFAIDKLDSDETAGALQAAQALERQLREVVVPEIDTYRFGQMAANAGTSNVLVLDASNIYGEILAATEALDDANVPEDGRQLVVTAQTYKLLKESTDVVLETEIGQEARNRGVVAMVDGMEIIKTTATRVGVANFNFLVAHNIATTAPVKLAEYRIHEDPPGISGSLVEGRVYYDAFVLNNKASAIYLSTSA